MHRSTRASRVREWGVRRRLGRASLVTLALAMAGCAAPRQDIQTSTIATRLPLESAMVDMPPGGPAIVGVVERNYANATTQEIVLANRSRTPGQNMLTITMFGPVKLVTGTENVRPNDPLATLNVGKEIREALPGVPMEVSNLYAQNRYGAFGYATGRTSAGDTCLYAWQRIRAPDHDSTMISNQGTISIRLRLCEPKARETALLDVMTGFNINAYFLASRWNPFGPPPPPPEELGKPGETVVPPESAFAPPPAASVRARRAAAPAPAATAAPTVAPAEVVPEGIPVVPPPTIAPEAALAPRSSGVRVVTPGAPVVTRDGVSGVVPEDYPIVPPP